MQLFRKKIAEIDAAPLPHGFTDQDIADAIGKYEQVVSGELSAAFNSDDQANIFCAINMDEVAQFCVKSLYKQRTFMDTTGVVIAGYGVDDFFPGYIEYTAYGNILDKIAYDEKSASHISFDDVSDIKAFATDAMISTFLFWISDANFAVAADECKKQILTVAKSIGADNHPDLDKAIAGAMGDFGSNFFAAARKINYWPLWGVITSLPLDDMAELAETLVRLESLKEKVTQPTQSVGGPVDVAIITKHDGFIWKKRKLYFDGELNPRYFNRLGCNHN